MTDNLKNHTDNQFTPFHPLYDAPLVIYESVLCTKIYDVYFNRPFLEPRYYTDICHKLRTGAPTDTFMLYLNNPGGSLDAGIQIIHAIRDCQSKVITILDGTVCSMGAILFLAGHEKIVHDTARMMLHNYSGGIGGKGNEQIAQIESNYKYFHQIMANICVPFISKSELTQLIQGVDFWLDSDEIRNRISKNMNTSSISTDNTKPSKPKTKSKNSKKS